MPHFHFHVVLRGDLFEDRDGCNYFDLKSAKVYARRLAIDLGRTGNFAGATVLVVDGFGQEVAHFPVDNVVVLPRNRRAPAPSSDTRHADADRLPADVPCGRE